MVAGSSRKSSLVPTRMMGTLGAWWEISGSHCGEELVGVPEKGEGEIGGSWNYLVGDVGEGWGRDDGETDEEDVGLGVGERAETVVVFLAGGIPEAEGNGLSVDHDTGGVVVETGRG